MPAFRDLVGYRFGRLVVLSLGERAGRATTWECKCDCGAVRICSGPDLMRGHRASCGCLRLPRPGSKGAHNRTWKSWAAMRARCLVPGAASYEKYGARGVQICSRWLSYEAFLADMGERPTGMTLDRINSAGNYEPGNCRWATAVTQNANRRTARLLTFAGKTQNVSLWARELGIPEGTIFGRLYRGQSADAALRVGRHYSRSSRKKAKAA